MIVIEVPSCMYERAVDFVQTHHRSAWAVVDVRPGRSWRVHRDPWERTQTIWRAEDLLRALREGVGRKR